MQPPHLTPSLSPPHPPRKHTYTTHSTQHAKGGQMNASSREGGGEGDTAERSSVARRSSSAAANPATTTESSSPLFTAAENAEFQAIVAECKTFEDCERQYQAVLMTLEGDDVLDRFRVEYDGLHSSLLRSHEGEGRLLRKCADLQSDIEACAEKAIAAAELTLGDRDTIANLKAETERTSRRLVQVKEKEAQLKEAVTALKREIAEQQAKAQDPIDLPAQEAALHSLRRLHETLQREDEQLTQQLRSASLDAAATQRRITALVNSNSANTAELDRVREAISRMEEEAQMVLASKAVKEQELRAVRDTIARRLAYHISQQHTLDALGEDHERNGQELRDVKHEETRLTEEYQGVCRQLQHVNTALQECNEENDLWQRRVHEKAAELQAHQASIASVHKRCLKTQKVVEALQRRNAVAEERKSEQLEKQREAVEQLKSEEAALARAKQAARTATQTAASVREEVNLLQQHITGEAAEQQRNATWLAAKRGHLRLLESVLMSVEEHIQQTRHEVYVVAQEAETSEASAKKYAFACAHLLSDIEHKDAELAQSEERLKEVEARIEQQQALLESMVAERNTYIVHYDQLKHGLSEQQHEFALLLAKVQAMRSAIQKHDKDVKLELERIQLLRQQHEELEAHVVDYQRRASKKQRCADALGQEVRQLRAVLSDAAAETARQQRRCRDVVHERDILERQATDRATELHALYERAHTQQTLLQHHEGFYNDHTQQLEHLEYQTARFAQQLEQMRMFVARLPELRVLLNNAARELQREKVRVRALLDDAGHAVNVHPYHELASAEPEAYALLKRVQKLQRVLVQRHNELEEKEAAIQSVEQRYMKAKATVAHQPGPEIVEQLTAHQQNLIKRNQQMRQMQEALEFFRSQTDQFKARHDVLRERLADMGKTYAAARAEEERRSRVGNFTGVNSTAPHPESPLAADELAVYHGFVAPPRSTTSATTHAAIALSTTPGEGVDLPSEGPHQSAAQLQ
ncbi:hypothetical protein LSCM1_08287 [Leishmania martiniquensis]|uniref:Cilia- and flagella-associated protein 58 central coiled coil domain-containing protein n=1 Tax=Leishmania martiniquensis TaxID=1580590 RepID=A0A836KUY1_9TRYP|nr:hypothetical protein LSCM1_08287 [Leishmania martiniquensis]